MSASSTSWRRPSTLGPTASWSAITTLRRDVCQVPYELPADLDAAIVAFVSYYNDRRYDKALGNVTPSDVLRGMREEILQRRKEVQTQTSSDEDATTVPSGGSPDLHPTSDLSGRGQIRGQLASASR